MKQQDKLIEKGQDDKVLLKKVIYGLKQSSVAWFSKVHKVICP